jgi:hypothetical protein
LATLEPVIKSWPWGWISILSGVLLAITGVIVVSLLGTPEGQQISPRWYALPGVFALILLVALVKIATRKL